jgi:hypothetical protein
MNQLSAHDSLLPHNTSRRGLLHPPPRAQLAGHASHRVVMELPARFPGRAIPRAHAVLQVAWWPLLRARVHIVFHCHGSDVLSSNFARQHVQRLYCLAGRDPVT